MINLKNYLIMKKNNKFEKIIATKKVNQSEAIVVLTLLFLT